MGVRRSVEGKRGCGYRSAGGLYLMGGKFVAPCGRLPLALDRCPTCSHGIKRSRGLQWINAREFWSPGSCAIGAEAINGGRVGACYLCPCGEALPERAALLWIGAGHYPTPASFLAEAAAHGISRRLAQMPKDLEVGEDRVFLVHPRAFDDPCPECRPGGVEFILEPTPGEDTSECPRCEGEGRIYRPGAIGTFIPERIEKVVTEVEAQDDEAMDALRKRGIEPVIVERAEEWPKEEEAS